MNNLTPEEELAEIDWACGLTPMPPHLVELGTVVRRYTHELAVDPADLHAGYTNEADQAPVTVVPHRIVRLAVPRTEVTVWGERQ